VKKLKLAEELSLPVEAVTQKLAWIGTTGSGKTYGATKLAELMWDAGAQFIVLDPVGVWYGLRLAADGKKPSDITIPVFGGLHGDVPIEPTGGAFLADLVIDRGISAVLDVSQFETDADKARFAGGFADRFFFRKKASPSAVHLFIEECQEFVPENEQHGEERMKHAFIRMQKIGRNFGIGTSLITQRPQDVSKKALNLAQTLFVFRTTGSHERKAIESWIKDKAIADQDIGAELPKLKTGRPHVWSPEWLEISEVVGIFEKRTFNASATPEVGAAAVARELAPIDLERIRTDMAATIEKAKAEDPKLLREQIARLQRELAKKGTVKIEPRVETKVERVAVPMLTEGHLGDLKAASGRLQTTFAEARGLAERIDEARNSLITALHRIDVAIAQATKPVQTAAIQKTVEKTRAAILPARQNITPPTVLDGGPLPKGELAVLRAVAHYPEGCSRKQLTVLTGYKRSTRDTYLQRLSEKGLVQVAGTSTLATSAGLATLGPDFEPLPIGDALLQHWRTRLPEGERKILDLVVAAHPDPVARDAISDATGYARSSRDTYLQRLGAKRLVEADREGVKASDLLFDGAA
jgi:hypothetical protein